MDPVCCAFPMTLKTLLNILYTTVLNHAHANKAEEGRAKRTLLPTFLPQRCVVCHDPYNLDKLTRRYGHG